MVEPPEEPEPPEPPEPPTGKPKKPMNRALEWFSKNPVFGLIGFLVGVVSLTATVYFGIATLKSRDLSLTVNPTRTTIVKAGQSSDLHVLYKGQSVATDVTGLQVGIWNAGRESIRPEHILSPIILQTSPKVPILEVRVRHTSRPVCGIVLDDSHLVEGKVGLSWRILEHNDGAVVQFIVAGLSTVSISPAGVVEGQRGITVVRDYTNDWRLLVLLGIPGFLMPITLIIVIEGLKKRFGIRSRKPFLLTNVYMFAYVGVLWGIYRLLAGSGVPFRFD